MKPSINWKWKEIRSFSSWIGTEIRLPPIIFCTQDIELLSTAVFVMMPYAAS